MKKDIRIAICVVGIILLVILCIYRLLADKEIADENNQNPIVTAPVPTERVLVDPKDGKAELTSVNYYIVDISTKAIKPAVAVTGKKEDVTAAHIVEYITDALEDEEIELTIKDIVTDNGLCIVDFDENIYKIIKDTPDLEKPILDAVAMSLVDNLQEINEVSFRIAGQPYSTSAFQLKDKEGYLGKWK